MRGCCKGERRGDANADVIVRSLCFIMLPPRVRRGIQVVTTNPVRVGGASTLGARPPNPAPPGGVPMVPFASIGPLGTKLAP
jgi:hypothetical protein